MNVLYLQWMFSKNSNPLSGRRLYEALRRDATNMRLAYRVVAEKGAAHPEYPQDFITQAELAELQPDLVFIERGLVELGGQLRLSLEDIERLASNGAVVIASDVDFNQVNQYRQQYESIAALFGVAFAVEDGGEPAEMFDRKHYRGGHRQILCHPADMAFEDWLAPVYQGIETILASLPVPLQSWVELVATGNRNTTEGHLVVGGHSFPDAARSSAFAAARRFGNGYLVLIAATVSPDSAVEACPQNLEWLKRLGDNLVDRLRIDRRSHGLTHQLFISHRHRSSGDKAGRLRDELRRRGFGTWLDVRELAAGDALSADVAAAITASSHFVLLWTADCIGATWIERETAAALKADKRIILVRFDDSSPPAQLADRIRIEAQAISPEEAARLITINIERHERRPASSVPGDPAH
jgi:hypothetical protein